MNNLSEQMKADLTVLDRLMTTVALSRDPINDFAALQRIYDTLSAQLFVQPENGMHANDEVWGKDPIQK